VVRPQAEKSRERTLSLDRPRFCHAKKEVKKLSDFQKRVKGKLQRNHVVRAGENRLQSRGGGKGILGRSMFFHAGKKKTTSERVKKKGNRLIIRSTLFLHTEGKVVGFKGEGSVQPSLPRKADVRRKRESDGVPGGGVNIPAYGKGDSLSKKKRSEQGKKVGTGKVFGGGGEVL